MYHLPPRWLLTLALTVVLSAGLTFLAGYAASAGPFARPAGPTVAASQAGPTGPSALPQPTPDAPRFLPTTAPRPTVAPPAPREALPSPAAPADPPELLFGCH